jgi:hypothetical protein
LEDNTKVPETFSKWHYNRLSTISFVPFVALKQLCFACVTVWIGMPSCGRGRMI